MKPTDKHFRCSICQRGFTRVDHLKRHHLRHSGQRPYSCVFCEDSFARCDNLRDHYTDCPKRGDREIPETAPGYQCTSMKLRCDGQSPCGSCQKRNLECNNQRTGVGHLAPGEGTTIKHEPYAPSPSDRGSIKFLLNGGTDSFTEDFRLPPRSDRARGLDYYNRLGLEEARKKTAEHNGPGFDSGFANSDPVTPHFFQETFIDFFYGPFGDAQKPLGSPYTSGELAYQAVMPESTSNFGLPSDQSIFESERPFALALVQSILTRAWQVPLDAAAQQELSANLNFVLTTARIRKFISLYFEHWHPSSSILHVSFDPEAVPSTLLAAVAFMGAMYSNDQREVYIAKKVLDFAELFIFSSDVYSTESDIATIFSGGQCCTNDTADWPRFQNYQAGLIMLLAQYWAGNPVSRNRAMEQRFSEVLKVARQMELIKSRHVPEDQALEHLWIQKECRIRTASVIVLIDSAFNFFQNYPCRLTQLELRCDLPCDETLFSSQHPFSEPNFRFARELTMTKAFENFLDESYVQPMDLNIMDMFILIHLIYSYINNHMAVLGPLILMGQIKQPTQSAGDDPQEECSIPNDSILLAVKTALSRWREYWVILRSRISNEQWASMGFYKNAYNFWLVSQLLITNKNAVDVIMRTEVHCEDKLEKLKVLLRDDQEDV
ncbi:transcriptional regulator family: Fungal Specific TF [Penicillium brevicompactum]|uniref:Transcriptional regulator family: Fungal Specific TF n=1 Tax=Penicillium brevicompactum TaxID=5074 RepID=A0A9W9UEF5_PENBR|nr:transcriptional regulator family: Fungal Specific TF [Penicillium brevicompactum]